MHIAIVGWSVVGLVSGGCFAGFSHAVACVDNDSVKIAMLGRDEMPTYKSGLANTSAGRLSSTIDLAAAVGGAEVPIIAIGTPSRHGDGRVDVSLASNPEFMREEASSRTSSCRIEPCSFAGDPRAHVVRQKL